MKEYLLIINALIFLSISIGCLLFPKKIQKYAIKDLLGKEKPWYYPFFAWVKTPTYIYTLRGIGVMAFIIFGLALYVLLFQK